MNRITAVGAMALLAVGLGTVPAAAAPVALEELTVTEQTCPKEGKVDVGGEQTEVTLAAPEGRLISGYCVKAGSEASGAGVHYVELDTPVAEVTISHPSGKAISHYTLVHVEGTAPEPSEEPTVEEPEPTVEPSEPSTAPSEAPVEEPAEPSVEPTDADMPGGDAAEPAGDGGELAATGAGPAIGYALLALAVVGGGVTLLVLRKRRMS